MGDDDEDGSPASPGEAAGDNQFASSQSMKRQVEEKGENKGRYEEDDDDDYFN